ncbi:hypothetical protein JOF53_008302 [Crossiella equi]|uniref:Uncharacterized protein n=1 Tax=Crossiella equi TaxID=130796 RepID=A0ABS5AS89_9PSEU|nr:hypothetical protein [Crossiella equi]MBP2479430.1 hypothetical protein [Crossiella equi]
MGAVSGGFASPVPPTPAAVDSSAAVIEAHQDFRGRRFTEEEQEIAWAAGLWPAAHNARWESPHDDPPISGEALRAQPPERLRQANA